LYSNDIGETERGKARAKLRIDAITRVRSYAGKWVMTA